MSRSCVVAYEWSPGVVRGTLVQNGEATSKDGARTLLERMRSEGYQSMVRAVTGPSIPVTVTTVDCSSHSLHGKPMEA